MQDSYLIIKMTMFITYGLKFKERDVEVIFSNIKLSRLSYEKELST